MLGLNILKGAAVGLATLGILLPPMRVLAEEPNQPSRPTVRYAPANSILDVRLGKDGSFTGRTVNHEGIPVVGAKVVVKQGKVDLGQTVTDQQGNFAFKNLKSGVYEVGSGATVGTYRIWSEKTAPPGAKPHSLLVLGENGARGQYGLTETIVGQNLGLILLVSTTGLALAGTLVALHAERMAKDAKRAADAAVLKTP